MEQPLPPHVETPQATPQAADIGPRSYRAIIIAAVIIVLGFFLSAAIIGVIILFAGRSIVHKLEKNAPLPTNTVSNTPVSITLPDNAPMLGNPDAQVTVIEYADFQCPFCEEFYKKVYPQLKKDYIDTGKIKFYFQDFAFLGDESFAAAEAARCAQDQNAFWPYYDTLFQKQGAENSGSFSATNLKQFAQGLVSDQAKFAQCVDSGQHKTEVVDTIEVASSYGVSATPTVFINGLKYEGAKNYSIYKAAIDKALQ